MSSILLFRIFINILPKSLNRMISILKFHFPYCIENFFNIITSKCFTFEELKQLLCDLIAADLI